MLVGAWMTQAIYVAAELGIADLLAAGPRTVEELAEDCHAHASSLYRVLRALASVGIFAEDAHGRFSLTPLAEQLRSDAPDPQRAFAIMLGAEFYKSWGKLLHGVKTGGEAFRTAFGVPFFQYMTEHPERHSIYDAAMESFAVGETEPMIDAYDFSPFKTVADVGGGNGLVLASILKRHPGMKGILFDLPAVADRARTIVSGFSLDGQCQIVGGDFFASVPTGVDAYVLRHIIHDWNDDDAVAILRNCREAMNPEGRVLVVEIVIPPGNEPCFGKWLDLMMLVVGGRERTEEQYRRLFAEAGLKLSRIVPTAAEISVIEGIRAS
ncbi:MAG: methyltransferase [Candidatus Abyssobacteria bacterium SURF_17]|uniref:Methyltransferase n=1 Tax=Candidatus Abyssobacteria bacterium SURF_17 TaxID=2093361 RepID=A0A419F8A7_9BACT|nr:MAG: methyltransferase [Candidatus Abyssubacteria bacterium SURF_17]